MKINIRKNNQLAGILLRIGLASVLLYAAISSLMTPDDWIGYVPHSLTHFVSARAVLDVMSVYQIVLAVWLLSGIYLRLAAAFAALTFTGILLANVGIFAITFRDITMIFASAALILLDER